MTKTDWISVAQSESRENINTQQIIWDSSSSDDECFVFNKKKRKKHSEINVSPVMNSQKSHLLLTRKDINEFQSTRSTESPVIGLRYFELYKLSPEVSQRSSTVFVKEPSPVIEKRRVRLLKRHKSKENQIKECTSPDLFNYDPTQNILDSTTVDPLVSQETIKIEPFPSQFSSQVKPTDIPVKDISLYYDPPKRKKKYNTSGLAYQLHKVLKVKKSRVKIWQHEKINNIEDAFENPEHIVWFKLKKNWNEYGNTILLCEIVNKSVTIKRNFEGNIGDIFLVNIGSNMILNIEWVKDNFYQMYPPYNVDRVLYEEKDTLYFSSVSKFMNIDSF